MLPNLNLGTVITNSAGIYFDFNAPVITNQTFHTIGTDFINILLTSVDLLNDKPIEINVYPNPADNYVIFETDFSKTENLSIQILDVTGRIIRTQDFNNSRSVIFNRNELPAGIYFFEVLDSNKFIKSGKIIMK